jgi:menaquinone-dependent protoporphyrinogen IX oxidase
MKIAVVYKSFLGSTRKYAEWIAEEYQADLYTYSKATDDVLQKYDIIVVASGTYAAFKPLTGFLKKHWDTLQTKKIIAVSVGMIPADDPQSYAEFELIPAEIQEEIHYYKVPGKLFKAGSAGEPTREKLQPVFTKITHLINSEQK